MQSLIDLASGGVVVTPNYLGMLVMGGQWSVLTFNEHAAHILSLLKPMMNQFFPTTFSLVLQEKLVHHWWRKKCKVHFRAANGKCRCHCLLLASLRVFVCYQRVCLIYHCIDNDNNRLEWWWNNGITVRDIRLLLLLLA